MADDGDWVSEARAEIEEGMAHEKCHACGCMHDALDRLTHVLEDTGTDETFRTDLREWQDELPDVNVDCRGCSHCYPAAATNIATEGVDDTPLPPSKTTTESDPDSEDGQRSGDGVPLEEWPPVPGEYHAMCTGRECPVAVSTLGDGELADEVASRAPEELCIVGRTHTENTGIEKVIKNVVTNPTIDVLILAGPEPEGHRTGETMKTLLERGVTDDLRIVDAPGRRSVLANATLSEIEAFREQIDVVDLIGCTDPETIIESVVTESETACTCTECRPDPASIRNEARIDADPSDPVRMDPAGYFVVLPRPEDGIIVCEHYDYHHERQHVVQGESADDIYREIIERELVSRLDHAAYLGSELTEAELAVSEGFDYEQDGIPE